MRSLRLRPETGNLLGREGQQRVRAAGGDQERQEREREGPVTGLMLHEGR